MVIDYQSEITYYVADIDLKAELIPELLK